MLAEKKGSRDPHLGQIAAKLAALSDMSQAALRAEWRRLFRSNPPRKIRGDLMVLAIAWKIQVKAHGGLTAAEKRRLVRIAEDNKAHGGPSKNSTIHIKPGLKLVREWRGETHGVLVLENGFEWNGQCWRSLSAIAREITGTQWSGPRFFGLQRRHELAARENPTNG